MGLASFLFLLKKKTLQAAILIKQIKNIIVNSIELGASGRMPLPLTPVSLKIKKKKTRGKTPVSMALLHNALVPSETGALPCLVLKFQLINT
jgi:hypothetical protein